jgi:hypothetical protein
VGEPGCGRNHNGEEADKERKRQARLAADARQTMTRPATWDAEEDQIRVEGARREANTMTTASTTPKTRAGEPATSRSRWGRHAEQEGRAADSTCHTSVSAA